MQIRRADGDLQRQIAPCGTVLLLTGRFQVRVLARELSKLASDHEKCTEVAGAGVTGGAG
jgi:hypothetical protein